jgi:hypothetical protein
MNSINHFFFVLDTLARTVQQTPDFRSFRFRLNAHKWFFFHKFGHKRATLVEPKTRRPFEYIADTNFLFGIEEIGKNPTEQT